MLHMADEVSFLYYIPWFVWIVIFGIIGGVIITAIQTFGKRNDKLAKALEQNTLVNQSLIERLDAIDGRLGTVEKTLTDIP